MIRLSEIAEALGGQLLGDDKPLNRLCTDTRQLKSGETYLALKGANFDGHDFINKAVELGAAAVICEKANDSPVSQIVVSDTLLALGQIAHLNRLRFKGSVLAITGSSGKTSVKNMLANILSQSNSVCYTQGNFNNQVGVPLTLLNLNAQDFAVIEAGTSQPGEIRYLSELIKPDVSVVTNVAAAHLEGFGSLEKIAEEKSEIYAALSESGTAIVNLDENYQPLLGQKIKNNKVIGFSLHNQEADVSAENISLDDYGRASFTLNVNGSPVAIKLPVSGVHNVSNALCAASCASAVNASLSDIQQGLQTFKAEKQRMQIIEPREGLTVIDDTYNANAGSVRAAIDTLVRIKTQRCLVLGDLGEIGSEASEIHQSLGCYAAEQGVQHLVAVGQHAQATLRGFNDSSKNINSKNGNNSLGHAFDKQENAISQLNKIISQFSPITCLVKGSRSAAMEVTVKNICQVEEEI